MYNIQPLRNGLNKSEKSHNSCAGFRPDDRSNCGNCGSAELTLDLSKSVSFLPYKLFNNIMIQPYGEFYNSLDAHSKYQVWENATTQIKKTQGLGCLNSKPDSHRGARLAVALICDGSKHLKTMKKINYLIILLISLKSFGQTKPIVFYSENGEKITKEHFLKLKENGRNLDFFFENDTLQFGLLVPRQKFGHLDQKTFTELKSYLTELSNVQIDSTQNIVINYLTAIPKKKENTKPRSRWNVLDKDYLEELHEIANINQFWINSPESDNLKYYHQNRINWISDNENLFKKLFFPYKVRYANYILIKPDGKFFYSLGEHSKHQIWENAIKYFQ